MYVVDVGISSLYNNNTIASNGIKVEQKKTQHQIFFPELG